MSEFHVDNLNQKTLREFQEGDTLYIRKVVRDYCYAYHCKFLRLDKGVVVAEILNTDRDFNKREIGSPIRARAKACYLWGKREEAPQMKWGRCHWFVSLDEPAV